MLQEKLNFINWDSLCLALALHKIFSKAESSSTMSNHPHYL